MFAFYVSNIGTSYPKVVIIAANRNDVDVHWHLPERFNAWWSKPFSLTLMEYFKRRSECITTRSS